MLAILNHSTSSPLRYLVVADPPGAKIGNGGATMHAIEQIKMKVPSKDLETGELHWCSIC